MKWKNYGFSLTEEQSCAEFAEFCESYGFTVYRETPSTVYVSGFVDEVDTLKFDFELKSYYDGLTAYIKVSVNNNADSAAGTVYKIIDESNVKVESRSCEPNQRASWGGISYDDLLVDGGLYA